MKKIILYSTLILTVIFSSNFAYSDIPTYELRVIYSNYLAANILEFEIYLKHTNPDDAAFEYTFGQYMFNFNTDFANNGTLTYSVSPGANVSDLPTYQRPNCTKISNSKLRLTTTSIPAGPGLGTLISTTGFGTKIIRMRLQTTASSFAGNPDLTWKNSLGYVTKVFSYIGMCAENITVPASHLLISIPDPVTACVTVFPGGAGYPNLSSAITAIKNGVHPYPDLEVRINCDVLEAGNVFINDGSYIPNSITIYPTEDNITIRKTALPFDNISIFTGSTEITIDGRKNKTGNERALTIFGNYNNDIGMYGCLNLAWIKKFTVQYVNFETESNYAINSVGNGFSNTVINISNNVFKIIPKQYGGAFFPRAISFFYPKGTVNITNNFIYNTNIPISPITTNLFGIYVTRENHAGLSSDKINMIYNTVLLQGGNLNGYSTCANLEYNGNTYFERNNIFINNMTSGGGLTSQFAKSVSQISSTPNYDIDYNCYYTANPGTTGGVVNWQNSILASNIKYVSLPSYQCDVYPYEQHTKFREVHFATNSYELVSPSIGDNELTGIPVTTLITNDIVNTPRHTEYPYMGAWESSTTLTRPPGIVTITPFPPSSQTTFSNLKSAFEFINGFGSAFYQNEQIPITIEIHGTTHEPGTAILYPIIDNLPCTIKPGQNATAIVSPSSCSANFTDLIVLDGADNVTFDGNVSGERKLTFEGNGEISTCLKMINGAEHNKLSSVISQGATGDNIFIAGSEAPAITGNNDNTIERCKIVGGTSGVKIFDNNTFSNDNIKILTDTINNCSSVGISVKGNALNTEITRNEIFNTATVSTLAFIAIEFNANATSNSNGNKITQNKIYDFDFDNTLTGIFGIDIRPTSPSISIATKLDVNNNFISLGTNVSGMVMIMGIRTFPLTIQNFTENIYYNSVYIGGTGSGTSYGIILTQLSPLNPDVKYNQKNNISVNERTGGISLASSIDPGSSSQITFDIDYNCYWGISQWNSTQTNDICAYRTAAGTQEQNSIFKDVSFDFQFSPFTPGDLHLHSPSTGDFDLAGIPITGIDGDIDDPAVRTGLSNPYKGADEASPALTSGGPGIVDVIVNSSVRTFPNLRLAFDEINANLCQRYSGQDVEVIIRANTSESATAELIEITPPFASCVVKPVSTATSEISVTGDANVGPVIQLKVAKNVTFDGYVSSSLSKGLKINGDEVCIKILDGASNNIVKNLTSESIGTNVNANNIYIAGINSSLTATGNDNNIIDNCLIDGGFNAIGVAASDVPLISTKVNTGTKILNSEVRNFKHGGILTALNTKNNTIENNKVFFSTPVLYMTVAYQYGIRCDGVGNNEIKNNRICMTPNHVNPIPNTNYTGIFTSPILMFYLPGAFNVTNNNVVNNFISITDDNSKYITGIYSGSLSSNGGVDLITNVLHNTVYIGKTAISSRFSSIGIESIIERSGNTYNQKNNVSVNERTTSFPGTAYEGQMASSIQQYAGVTINADYNCYWGNRYVAYWGTTSDSKINLPDYHCAAFPNEQNTNFKQVTFVSPATIPDIAAAFINDYDLMGKPGVFATDINGTTRNADYPYMGAKEETAFEFDGTIRLRVFLDGVKKPELGKINVEIWERAQISGGGNFAGDALQPVLYSFNELSLNTSGTVSIECPAVYNKNFYIVIKYPGLLETWSRASGEFFPNSPASSSDAYYYFDLTTVDLTGRTLAFNNNLKQCCDHKYFVFTGDTQGEGLIDFDDYWNVVVDADANDNCSGFTSGSGTGTQTLSLYTNLDFSIEASPVRCPDICLAGENQPWYVEVKSNPGVGEDYVCRPAGFDNYGYHNTFIINQPYTSGWLCSCAY